MGGGEGRDELWGVVTKEVGIGMERGGGATWRVGYISLKRLLYYIVVG